MIKFFQIFCRVCIRAISIFDEKFKSLVLLYDLWLDIKNEFYKNVSTPNCTVFIQFLVSFSMRLEKLLRIEKNDYF